MDVLHIANRVNEELVQIHRAAPSLLDAANVPLIFNSVVTCLINDLADGINFTIGDPAHPTSISFSWEYDLRDKNYPIRRGTELKTVLESLQRKPNPSSTIRCDVQWSQKFLSANKDVRLQFLVGTIWEEQLDKEKSPIQSDVPATPGQRTPDRVVEQHRPNVDLAVLQLELLKLQTETKLIDKRRVNELLQSFSIGIHNGAISGIRFRLLGKDKTLPLAEWTVVVATNQLLVRGGVPLENVIGIALEARMADLVIEPIATKHYESWTEQEKVTSLKGTIWVKPPSRRWGLF